MPQAEKILDFSKMYKPLLQQERAHASTKKYLLYGGAAGGGKSHWLIWHSLLKSCQYDFPLTGAIFRRSFPELEATIIRRMMDILPNWAFKYNQTQHLMTLWNGSRIEFCYAESDEDVNRYQSREWDWLAVDELTHFSEYRFVYLLSRLRTTKPIKTKFFAATNPGGIGHQFVKERWVTKTSTAPGYDPEEYDFIPAKVIDNTFLMKANPDYVNSLKMLPEQERKALLDGDWEVFQGQFFEMWSPTRHVVQKFDVPVNWELVLGWDDGSKAPRAVLLFAIDNDKHVWCIWEYYRKGEDLLSAARNIREELQKLNYWDRIAKTVVDPSMKRSTNSDGSSSVEILNNIGFGFRAGEVELANNDRKEGWRIMKMYLSHKPYEEPMLKFFNTCTNAVKTIPEQIYYEKANSTKKEDLDTRAEDHACFVKGTMVLTTKGEKRIEEITPGDMVVTPLGNSRVLDCGCTGINDVYKYNILGTSLTCTQNHPIATTKGFLPIHQIVSGGEDINIIGMGDTMSQAATAKIEKESTNLFGKCLMVLFQMGFTFTMWILIRAIIQFKILNFWLKRNTLAYMGNETTSLKSTEPEPKDIFKVLESSRRHGIQAQRGKRGTKNITKIALENKETNKNYSAFVKDVKNISQQEIIRRYFVQITARVYGEGNLGSATKQGFVGFVKNHLLQINIKKYKPAQEAVHIGRKKVYNLSTELGMYYANGILVSNCDATRYALMSITTLPIRMGGGGTEFKIQKREYIPH